MNEIIKNIEKDAGISMNNYTQILATVFKTADSPQTLLALRIVMTDILEDTARERLEEL